MRRVTSYLLALTCVYSYIIDLPISNFSFSILDQDSNNVNSRASDAIIAILHGNVGLEAWLDGECKQHRSRKGSADFL